jgi:hypothetical protein
MFLKLQHIYTNYISNETFEIEKYELVFCMCLLYACVFCMFLIWNILS